MSSANLKSRRVHLHVRPTRVACITVLEKVWFLEMFAPYVLELLADLYHPYPCDNIGTWKKKVEKRKHIFLFLFFLRNFTWNSKQPHAVFPKMQALCWKVEHTQLSWGAPAPCNCRVRDANWKDCSSVSQLCVLCWPRFKCPSLTSGQQQKQHTPHDL